MRSRQHVLQLLTVLSAIVLLAPLAGTARAEFEMDDQSLQSPTQLTSESSMDETRVQLQKLLSSVDAGGDLPVAADTDIELSVDELLAGESISPTDLADSGTGWGDDARPRSAFGAGHIELVSDMDLRKDHESFARMPLDGDRSASSIKSLLAADGWTKEVKDSSAYAASLAEMADYQAFMGARSRSGPDGVTLLGLGGLVLFCSAGGGIALVYDRRI